MFFSLFYYCTLLVFNRYLNTDTDTAYSIIVLLLHQKWHYLVIATLLLKTVCNLMWPWHNNDDSENYAAVLSTATHNFCFSYDQIFKKRDINVCPTYLTAGDWHLFWVKTEQTPGLMRTEQKPMVRMMIVNNFWQFLRKFDWFKCWPIQ